MSLAHGPLGRFKRHHVRSTSCCTLPEVRSTIMSSLPDIKTNISRPSTHTPHPPARPECDVKPNLSEIPDYKPIRNFDRERKTLEETYTLKKKYLDLEEEGTRKDERIRLSEERQRLPAVKVELGLRDVKPSITILGVGTRWAPLDLSLLEDSDDDNIVSISKVKEGESKPVETGKPSPIPTLPPIDVKRSQPMLHHKSKQDRQVTKSIIP